MRKVCLVLLAATALASCDNDARVVSRNLSQAADNFEVNRRIVFYNGITNDYILVIEGLCSQEPEAKKLAVICKVGQNKFKKHFLGLSDNVTYFSEQMEPAEANVYHYRVTFKPSAIIPTIDVR
jgi:predicted small secreted protein